MLAMIVISLTAAIALLAIVALAAVMITRYRSPTADSESPCSDQGDQYCCDVEIIILDETLQLSNYGDCSIRIQGTGIDGVSLLYPSDVWMRRFEARRICQFQLTIVQHHTMMEENLMELKVSAADVAIRPTAQLPYVHYTMWKLKPAVYLQATHVIEHRIFTGQLLKTVNFSRAPARYYRIRTTNRPQMTVNGLYSSSNIGCQTLGTGRLQLMSTRIEPQRSAAMNLSDREIKLNIVQSGCGGSLNRTLASRMQDVPCSGVYSFHIRPKRSASDKDLLRMRLNEKLVSIEPPKMFGSLPLYCDIDVLEAQGGRPRKVISSELLSELQLPRRSHTYIITFSVAVGDEEDRKKESETSCTLE